jgi:hypothetical protein
MEEARRQAEAQKRQDRTRYARGAIAIAAFVVLLGAGWLFGGHRIIGPASSTLGSSQPEHRAGWIIREHADGRRCSYQRFDNMTGWVGAGATAECEDVRPKRKVDNPSSFSWGGR